MKPTYVLHRTFEGDTTTESSATSAVYYIADSKGVKRLEGTKVDKWLAALKPGTTVKLTSLSQANAILIGLKNQGVRLLTCHWHKTGIAKGLEPLQIAERFAALPDALFTEFVPREDGGLCACRRKDEDAALEGVGRKPPRTCEEIDGAKCRGNW